MNPVAMKRFNAIELLELLRQHGRISRSGLARLSRLSKPTVSDQIDALISTGLVAEVGTAAASSRGGKKATLVEFNAGYGLVVCVDIGSEWIRFAAADLASKRLHGFEHPTRPEQGAGAVLRCIKRGVAELIEHGSGRGSHVQVISVAAPGIVDVHNGLVIEADNIFGWRDFQLGQELKSAFHLPVYVDNDVNMAALAELHYGKPTTPRSFVLIRLDTGIGAGVVLDGKLYHGANFAAGEIGHMILNADAARGPASRRGYLESIVGGDRVRDRLRATQQKKASSSSAAHAVFDEVVLHLGSAVANIAAAYDPGAVILLGDAFELLLDRLVAITRKLVPWPVEVRLSGLGPEAALQGALAAGLSHAFAEIARLLQTGDVTGMHSRGIRRAAGA